MDRIVNNEVIRQLANRKSVRVYEDKPIPIEVKEAIIDAALQAPSAGAMMLYTILDITDQGLKDKLAVVCDNQPFIAKAPLVLIFLADYQRWYDTFRYADCSPRLPQEGDLLLAYTDTVIAAHNTVVAAESLGVGSCYIGDIIENCEVVRELLSLPDYTVPAAMLVFGYPTAGQRERKKPERFDRRYIVFENKYKTLSPEEHMQMHSERNQRAGKPNDRLVDDLQAFCARKYMSDFSREMSRSAALYIDKFRNGSR